MDQEISVTAMTLLGELRQHGVWPDRIQITPDESLLFEFFGTRIQLLDLYPRGDLVVVTNYPDREEIHELNTQDTKRAAQLIAHALLQNPIPS